MKTTETDEMLGYRVSNMESSHCVNAIMDWLKVGGRCRWLACINPHSYVTVMEDAPFSRALRAADWLIPDGVGVVLAAKILGVQIRKRVTGSDIFCGVLEELNRIGGFSMFFLGSTEETLGAIRARMTVDFPNVRVAGTYSPPFKLVFSDEDNERMMEAIHAAAPDVLWVGMTAPKQEKWIFENRDRLNVKFAAAVGAVFDFYTEKVKRSHPVFQKIGLEWLPRLIREPKRLWRRNFISAPMFLLMILKEKVRMLRSFERFH